MVRQVSSNDDSDINELLSTSLSELFPDAGKLDENTNHTSESTEREFSEADESDYQGNFSLRKMISFEQEENGDDRVTRVKKEEDDDSDSLIFGDVFPDYQDIDSVEGLEESFAQVVCDLGIRNIGKEQRRKVLKAFLGPMKSMKYLVRPVKIPRINSPIHFPTVKFPTRNKRKRVTFYEESFNTVDEESEDMSVDIAEHFSVEESEDETFCSWYSNEDYNTMKHEVLKTMEKIVRCHKKRRGFAETEYQTARGLELVTKDMIIKRKLYKVNSRHVVFDEQEEQRLSHTHDIERIRVLYVEASVKARDTALESGWKDQEAVHALFEQSFCISEENTYY